METEGKGNGMGTEPELRLLLSMGAPLMLSMFVSAFHNVLDTFFVARIPGIGDAAAAALTLSFPVEMLMTAFNVGTGVGVSAALSRALGAGDRERASRVAGNAMLLYALYYLVMLAFGLFAAGPFVGLFTDDPLVRELGCTYLTLMTCFSFVNMGEKCFEKLLQACGLTKYSMVGQIVASISDAVLDPIMIYGWLGCPAMGVVGAAVSTLIGHGCAIAISATLYFRKCRDVDHGLRYLRPDGPIIANVMRVGVPAIAMQGLMSVTTLGMNLILRGVSDAAITAYGVYYKLQNFVFMPAFGINNAIVPIIGYNLGAKRPGRVRNTVRCAVAVVLAIMALGFVGFQAFAGPIVGVFGLSDEFAQICVAAVRIVTWGFAFAGLNVLFQGVCQALGAGASALAIAALRLVVIVLPLAALLAGIGGSGDAVWWAFPVAEAATLAVAVALTRRAWRKATRGA